MSSHAWNTYICNLYTRYNWYTCKPRESGLFTNSPPQVPLPFLIRYLDCPRKGKGSENFNVSRANPRKWSVKFQPLSVKSYIEYRIVGHRRTYNWKAIGFFVLQDLEEKKSWEGYFAEIYFSKSWIKTSVFQL